MQFSTLPLLELLASCLQYSPFKPSLDQYAWKQISPSPLSFSSTWAVLGPFQIGTREAAWGADPLEYYGGFPSLSPEDCSLPLSSSSSSLSSSSKVPCSYPSSLTPNASVSWTPIKASKLEASPSGAKASLSISFPDVDWTFLQQVYGWAATQFQAWARGEIEVGTGDAQNVLLYADRVIELSIDGSSVRHFGGDLFALRKVPLVLSLAPGRHVLDVRLVRDVRAMGGIGRPSIDVGLEMKLASGSLETWRSSILVSDAIDGRLVSPYGSITVTNTGSEAIRIVDIAASDKAVDVKFLRNDSTVLAPGQTRPIPFLISWSDSSFIATTNVTISYQHNQQDASRMESTFSLSPQKTLRYSSHKVTHLHPGGIVSYFMLRPPSNNVSCTNASQKIAPVLLQFHGAGLEASENLVAHSLDSLPDLCAWVVFPTGVTPWSGDDWHTWGFADVEAAVAAIPEWIKNTGWDGIDVDINKWFVTGHSNGGQGTWYALAHRPDKIFAAAPVSGYLSIQTYVPFQLWRPMDPRKRGILELATASFRHELFASNFKGIPIYQQHGSADDNVPAYHSKFMHQLISETSWSSNYSELAGKGHWFDGVMITDGLQRFYHDSLGSPKTLSIMDIGSFELVVANPSDTESKFGIKVLYLLDPGMLGKIKVSIDRERNIWRFELENILAFEIGDSMGLDTFVLHDAVISTLQEQSLRGTSQRLELWRRGDAKWAVGPRPAEVVRQLWQLGGMDAILRTKNRFKISHHGPETFQVALQISRNLHQYFAADSDIVDHVASDSGEGNIITIAIGSSLPKCSFEDFPIRIAPENNRLMVRNPDGIWQQPYSSKAILGAIFIRPALSGRLELVVWGNNTKSLAQVARLVPMITGTGQPDFIIMREEGKWKGADAAALGFFDPWWNISKSSVLG